jgi:YD repeat-containing protein
MRQPHGLPSFLLPATDALQPPVATVSPDPDPGSSPGQASGPLLHRAQITNYDADGNVASVQSGTATSLTGTITPLTGQGWLKLAYDGFGRPTEQRLVTGAEGSITTHAFVQTSYDAKGRVDCQAQRMNPSTFETPPPSACTLALEGTFGPDRITRNFYDIADRVTQVQTAVGTADQADEVTTSYSDNGRATTLTDGEGNRTTIDYDGHDRPVKTRFPVPTAGANQSSATDYEELGYDSAGNVTSQRQRDGQVIAFGFDALNRMTSVNRPNGHYWETDDSFGYDLMGKLTSATHNDHAVAFSYDALGRLLSQADSYYGTTTAEYDAAGRRTRLLYPFGSGELRYDWLNTGEMSVLRDGSYAVLATFGYDTLGRRTSLSRLNGTSTSYGYDQVGRLASLGHDFAGTAHDVAFGYAYNPASQIVSRTASNPGSGPGQADAYSFTLANQNLTDSHNGLNQVTPG